MDDEKLSPRNLVRSLSDPVSGTSFGKLLLEDHDILTGAHIRKKLEAVETMPVDVKKQKKDRFNIKEKVSNFKHRFGLRGKLFAKRIHSMVELHGNKDGFLVKDIRSGPTVLMKCGERHVSLLYTFLAFFTQCPLFSIILHKVVIMLSNHQIFCHIWSLGELH